MKLLKAFFLLVIVAILSSCGTNDEIKVIKLAHGLDVKHSVHQAMIFMGEDLEKRSGGKMKVDIYPSSQLGSERECLELLQIGSLGMTKVSAGVLENFAPKMKIFGLPFLFKNKQHVFNVLDGPIGKMLLEDGIKYWLKGMGYYDAGSRSFYTKEKPINTPNDLAGLKIRVMESVSAMEMVRSLGGSPTPISWGELYTSLQQGVVDGAENNPPAFYFSGHYEVCKHYSLDEHSVLPDVLVMGTQLWDRLSKQEQQWLNESVKISIDYQRKLWAESEVECLKKVQEAGVKIYRPDKTLFSAKVGKMYDKYKDNKVMYQLIQDIKGAGF